MAIKKRLAIQLYGHVRTYRHTYENFVKFIIEPNFKNGYQIDIFFHTWEEFNRDTKAWYDHAIAFPTLNNKKLSKQDEKDIVKKYNPKKFIFDILPSGVKGQFISFDACRALRKEYEIKNNIHYDIILTTRFDIFFKNELNIDSYLEIYRSKFLKNIGLPDKFIFSSISLFRLGVIDIRYVNEGSLLFFTNYDADMRELYQDNGILKIIMNYNVNKEYIILRESQIAKISTSKPMVQNNKTVNYFKYGTAKTRIQNQLSYKLGKAMIINSKSLLGYIRMPFVLSYIKDKHKQEQKIYQEKIKKDPSLKLPPLESYPDYKEALKEKECFTYQLGEALIKANKTWYKGGYVKLWFEIRKLRKKRE